MPSNYDIEAPGVVRGFLLPIRNLQDITDSTSRIAPIFFQTMPSVEDSKSASYSEETPFGRAESYSFYQGSNSRSINLTLTYVAVNNRYDFNWVHNQISRLMALVYPIYTRNKTTDNAFMPPPMVLFNLGYHFVNVPCVVSSYSVNNDDEDPYEIYTMLPMINKIVLNMNTSYPYGQVPGHDDIASKFIGDPSFQTAGRGDAVLPEFTAPNYDNLINEVPISLNEDTVAATEYARTVEIRSARSMAVSRKLSDVAFSPENLQEG